MNLVSIDFETANTSRVSICAAGMAVFVDGVLAESPYWLVRPPKGHGWFREDFIECHGLTHLDVLDAPEFSAIAVMPVPESGLGRAINDRLRRAAAPRDGLARRRPSG